MLEWFESEEIMIEHMQYHGKDPTRLYCNFCKKKVYAQISNRIFHERDLKNKDSNVSVIPIGQCRLQKHLKY